MDRAKPMDSYGQFCPLSQAAEIVTQRWMPLVIRELLLGSRRFNDLHRGVPRMSRTLLARRLNELVAAGLVERRTAGEHPEYHLTQAGEELRPIIVQLGAWGKRWVQREVSRAHLDAGLLMWDLQRRIRRDRLPPRRVVVCFHLPDAPKAQQHFWLLLGPGQVDLCLQDPGYEEDLYVRAGVRTLTEVWLGDVSLTRALKEESIWLGGPEELRQAFPEWLELSVFAGIARQGARGEPAGLSPAFTSPG
jgi:DNA-binding HxlR family transcriptional regulator